MEWRAFVRLCRQLMRQLTRQHYDPGKLRHYLRRFITRNLPIYDDTTGRRTYAEIMRGQPGH